MANLFKIQNPIATISLVLGLLAMLGSIILGPDTAFLYLGIPAIVTGAIALSRIRKGRGKGIVLAIFGIGLGFLPILFTILNI